MSWVCGADVQRGCAENTPKVDRSMGRKIIKLPGENHGFRGYVGLAHSAGEQKTHPKWTAVWGGKSLNFRKI